MLMTPSDNIYHYKAEQMQYKPTQQRDANRDSDRSALCCTFYLHQHVAEGAQCVETAGD